MTRKWKRARYVAERHVIAERYVEFEIIGPPEIREVDPDARYFSPHRNPPAGVGILGPVLTVAGWGQPRRVAIAGVAT